MLNSLCKPCEISSPCEQHQSQPPLVLYVPELEEIRITPIIARKGYLNILEHRTNGWKKRWVVSTFSIRSSSHLVFAPSSLEKFLLEIMFVLREGAEGAQ